MGILTVATANTAQSERLDTLGADLIAIQQLSTLADQIRQITLDVEKRVVGRHPADLGVRLEPGSWSIAECLGHLTQTTLLFLPAISLAISQARKLSRNRRLKTGILPGLLIRSLSPPYRIRFKVLPQLAPKNMDSQTAWISFVESQSQLLEILNSAAGLAIDKVTIKSPVYARITYNIYGAFRMLVAHQRRHIWQIEQILKTLNNQIFPGVA